MRQGRPGERWWDEDMNSECDSLYEQANYCSYNDPATSGKAHRKLGQLRAASFAVSIDKCRYNGSYQMTCFPLSVSDGCGFAS